MPPFGPISNRDLVHALRQLGFSGPVPGTRHSFMIKGTLKVRIPNPHQGDISRDLLARILSQAGISRDEWEALQLFPELTAGDALFVQETEASTSLRVR